MLKKRLFGMMILIVGLTLAFIIVGCDNDTNPPPSSDDPQTVTYVSTDSGGNLYTLEITENLQGRSARYAAKQGDFFFFFFELFNSGTYTVALTYSGTVDTAVGNATGIALTITVNEEILNITIIGTEMTVISGNIVDKEGETVVETPTTLNPAMDVYVAGSVNSGESATATVWKNGVVQSLNYSSLRFLQDSSVFVSKNNDVYVAGTVFTGESYIATLWKNGVTQNLNGINKASASHAGSVFVSGNGDVYVAGSIESREASGDVTLIATLWKNGIVQNLDTANSTSCQARSVFVSENGDVYVVGDTNNAMLWKNGVIQNIVFENGGTFALLNSVFISGNGDVYIAGRVSSGGSEVATLWKNGIAQTLYQSVYNRTSEAHSVFVTENGDVYVAGVIPVQEGSEMRSAARLWKNGVAQNLSISGATGSEARSVYVTESGDVYVAGRVDSEDSATATLWKNGIVQPLNLGGGIYSVANSVFVKAARGN
jgi:predicted heme/steroid binding protein